MVNVTIYIGSPRLSLLAYPDLHSSPTGASILHDCRVYYKTVQPYFWFIHYLFSLQSSFLVYRSAIQHIFSRLLTYEIWTSTSFKLHSLYNSSQVLRELFVCGSSAQVQNQSEDSAREVSWVIMVRQEGEDIPVNLWDGAVYEGKNRATLKDPSSRRIIRHKMEFDITGP